MKFLFRVLNQESNPQQIQKLLQLMQSQPRQMARQLLVFRLIRTGTMLYLLAQLLLFVAWGGISYPNPRNLRNLWTEAAWM